jgi:DNA-directed RNA polymerase subunit RPC12/RpoP
MSAMSHEFLGEFPPFASQPFRREGAGLHGYVPGNYVAEPGVYVCTPCEEAIAPPQVTLKAGQRLPACPRCGPRGRWIKR